MLFKLDERLSSSSFKITDLALCEVRLKNNKNYPWLILIPRVENTFTEIFELDRDQQNNLMNEMTIVSRCLKKQFRPDKINIGSLGNIVSQLHIHVIARFKQDALWPHSVWQENLKEEAYSEAAREELIQQLRLALK